MIKNTKNQVVRYNRGQALAEIAIFGAILIFLIGVILREHLSTSQGQSHQIRAMKLALQESYQSSQESISHTPNSSRNSATVLFVEDRLMPDFNKYSTIDRTPFVASGSGTMTNRLYYPIDFQTYNTQPFGEVGYNLPIMDVFINGQHFPLTQASYVLRVLDDPNDASTSACPNDWVGSQYACNSDNDCPLASKCDGGLCKTHGGEYIKCRRQEAEWGVCNSGTCSNSGAKCSSSAECPATFYSMAVNGTSEFDANTGSFDLLRNDWDLSNITGSQNRCDDDVAGCPGTSACSGANTGICQEMAWQWRSMAATGASINISFGSADSPNYPSVDVSGSLKEQTLYAVSQTPAAQLLNFLDPKKNTHVDGVDGTSILSYEINGDLNGNGGYILSLTQPLVDYYNRNYTQPPNPSLSDKLGLTRNPTDGPLTAVVTLDFTLGDIDNSYDKRTSPWVTQPGLMQPMDIYTWVNPGTYLQIKEGELYNPETHQVVRSVSNKDHVDLISRMIQLSNNTGRFCVLHQDGSYTAPATLVDQNNETNPVKVCAQRAGDCVTGSSVLGSNISKTCYDPFQRIIYVRTVVGDKTTRKWFTDVTKGL